MITIIPMTAEDTEGKAYVHWKSWQETYRGLIDDSYLDNMTLEKCIVIAERWPDNILVAKDGDKVVGFVGFGENIDDRDKYGEVFSIYVLAEYHGRRVGYELMNAAFEKLAAYDTVIVWVLKGNTRAIQFYKRYGFAVDGTEKEIMLGSPKTQLRMVYRRKKEYIQESI